MIKNLLVLLTAAFILYACDEDSEPQAELDLTGEWSFVLPYANGSEQTVLDIASDSSIVIRYALYGIQPDTEPDQLNGTIDYYGDLTVSNNEVEFDIYEYVARDFYFGTGPDTLANQTTFFDDCIYEITGDTLTLTFTSYPADLPVRGDRKFVKLK